MIDDGTIECKLCHGTGLNGQLHCGGCQGTGRESEVDIQAIDENPVCSDVPTIVPREDYRSFFWGDAK